MRRIDFRYQPRHSWTCIGRPDDAYKTLVSERGALLYNYQADQARLGTYRFGRVVSFAVQTDVALQAVEQTTETARVPLVHTTLYYPHVVLRLAAIGCQDGEARFDVVLWRICCRRDTFDASTETGFLTGLWLQVQDTQRWLPASAAGGQGVYLLPAAARLPRGTLADRFVAADTRPQFDVSQYALGLWSAPQPLQVASAFDFGPASGLVTEPALVSATSELEGALFFPQSDAAVDGINISHDTSQWSYARALASVEAEKRFWQGFPTIPTITSADTASTTTSNKTSSTTTRQAVIDIPDDEIAQMLEASARNILQAREIHDGLAEYQVGPTIYRGLWIIDGYFFLEAAQYLGHHEAAGSGTTALARRVQASGAIEARSEDTKDTGVAIATVVRQCELTGDVGLLEQHWPMLKNAGDYIRTLHHAAKQLDPDHPAYGLLPPSFGNGGLGGWRPEYTTALWLLTGLTYLVRAAHTLGHESDAQDFQTLKDDIHAAMLRLAARDQQHLPDGTPYWPMWMPTGSSDHHWQQDFEGTPPVWHQLNPGSGTWALAHAIYPGELFAADDPIVKNFCALLEQLDDRQGIPEATGWLPYEAVWTYAASFYAHVWLYAGRGDKALDYLYAFANHATPTRVWREEQSLSDSGNGQYFGDMPHNWASVEFIRLVRNCLVFERAAAIELLAGLSVQWVATTPLHIQTPTRFGWLGLTVVLSEANGIDRGLEITVDARDVNVPVYINLHTLRTGWPDYDVLKVNDVPMPMTPTTEATLHIANEYTVIRLTTSP